MISSSNSEVRSFSWTMGLFHVGGGVSSFLGQLWSSFRQLGDVWESDSASEAFRRGDLKSQAAGATLRIAFRNATPLPLLLCWISDSGTPHHFYTLHPQTDVLLSDVHVTENDKIETTVVGHCFALACCEDHDAVRKSKTLNSDTIIGGYRATRLSVDSSEDSGIAVHVLTITQSSPNPVMCSPRPHLERASCWGLRGSNILETDQEEDDGESKIFRISVCEGIVDRTPLDTSDKHYSEEVLGGWPVRVEPGWDRDSPGIRKQMIKDLKAASKCLPVHARVHLQKTTPIYINRSQKYGPELCPVDGRACCFHPHKAWLVENGMCIDKAECVEMYRSSDYMKDRKFWGPGGLILHELSHAYHWKMVEDGYDNEVISKCYRRAMKDGLYDCVSVHGRDKPTKAYACENQMEYFAELSVAFLGGLDKTKEHNKWFPFCRDQLKEHDPRAYRVLQRIWKVHLDRD